MLLLYGPEKFPRLSRNGPQDIKRFRKTFEETPTLNKNYDISAKKNCFPCFKESKFGRTGNAVGTRFTGESFH